MNSKYTLTALVNKRKKDCQWVVLVRIDHSLLGHYHKKRKERKKERN